MGTKHPLPKRHSPPPIFGPCLLWPNGCMYQDTTCCGGRHQPRRHCVREGPSSPPLKGHSPQFSANVRCGQTAGWTKMPLGMDLSDYVFYGDSAPQRKKSQLPTQLLAHVYCGQTAGWMKTPLGTDVDLGPGHIVLHWDPAPPPQKGHNTPSFRPMSIVATVVHLSYC